MDKALIHKILCGIATEQELQGLSREDLLAIKGDRSEMHFRFVPGAVAMERAVGDDDARPTFKHVASDESMDSVGDRILVKGWELERFQKNPQLLWAHDQRSIPLGSVVNVWKKTRGENKALMSESRFHTADENPQAPLVERLVAKGALPGVSVGFVPLEMVWPESENERKELGLGPWGVLHKRSELLELSVVPVPANGNALRVKSLERAKPLLALAREEGMDPELIEAVERAFNLTEESERALRRRMIIVPDLKTAVAEVLATLDPPPPETPSGDGDDDGPDGDGDDDGQGDGGAEEKTFVSLIRLDPESLQAIKGLTEALNKSAPQGGTDAESAEGDTPPAGDPPVPADDPGGDFLTRAARHAAQRLGSA